MSRRARIPADAFTTRIDSLAKDCRGVAHIAGKAIFIEGALPGELVEFRYSDIGRRYDEGYTVNVLEASKDRVEPQCEHYAICGGCSLQHMHPDAQVKAKHVLLAENLKRIGKVEPDEWLAPLTGPQWGYRRKARLGARFVIKKERALVGFREKRSSKVAEIRHCRVLHPEVGPLVGALADLLTDLDARESIPQFEVSCGDTSCILVVRHLNPLTEPDREKLIAFGRRHQLHIELQPHGPASVHPLWPDKSELNYRLPEFDVRYPHKSADFTQINADINRRMVHQAIGLLNIKSDDRVLDLFCGIGNFTLPIARSARAVIGAEGDASMVERAQEIASFNKITNATFVAADLTVEFNSASWFADAFDSALLDPPRSGALEVMHSLGKKAVPRIVYVSCHPASLARDADVLVHDYDYTLRSAGVMDMFPHTAHVESIAVFEKA